VGQSLGYRNKSDNEEERLSEGKREARRGLSEFLGAKKREGGANWRNKSGCREQQVQGWGKAEGWAIRGRPISVQKNGQLARGNKPSTGRGGKKGYKGRPSAAQGALAGGRGGLQAAWEASQTRRARLKARERVSEMSMALAVFWRPNQGERLRLRRI
jgi:hypothetical protein